MHNLLLKKSLAKRHKLILTVLILCAFLCATLSHSAHSELIQDTVELQQCKLCQHGVDTPPNTVLVKLINVVYYQALIQFILTPDNKSYFYFIPQLRAPPFHQ